MRTNHGKNHLKVLALDLGDVHVGVAISDDTKTIGAPLTTIAAHKLQTELAQLISLYMVDTIVVGLPITLRGTESQQTIKIRQTFEQLQQKFPQCTFVLWDERLTSKQASIISQQIGKVPKTKQHAIAASIMLGSYLDYLRFQKERVDQPSE